MPNNILPLPGESAREALSGTPARLLSIQQFVRIYGISRAKTYELLKVGELKAVKVGGRTLIPIEAAEQWARALPLYKPATETDPGKSIDGIRW